jgi:tetratricopeptide (TPR) repeat protein
VNEKVAQSFRNLYLTKRTGLLVCEGEDARRALNFRSGFVVGARSSRVEDRLGELLIRKGRITKQQFEDAAHFIKSGWKLGEILVELKLLEKDEVEQFVRIQLLEIARSVLIEPPRKITFAALNEVDSFVSTPVSVADIIAEAARTTPDIEKLKENLIADARPLGFSTNSLLRFQDISLSPEEAYILSRIDGKETVQGILSLSPTSEDHAIRTLMGLLLAGVIEPEGEGSRGEGEPETAEVPAESVGSAESVESAQQKETPDRTAESDDERRAEVEQIFEAFQHKNHWEVLDLERGAGIADIKKSFQEKALRYHPDRYRKIEDPGFQEKLSYVFTRISEAYETLSTEAKADDYKKLAEKEAQYEEKQKAWTSSPAESAKVTAEKEAAEVAVPEQKRDPNEAKAYYAKAKKAFDLEDYWTAIQFCQQAIEIVTDKAEYYHLLGMAQAKNPKWRLDAERNLKIATNLDPWKSRYLVDLGRLYEQAGMNLRAQRAFDQAKAIDPSISVEEEN